MIRYVEWWLGMPWATPTFLQNLQQRVKWSQIIRCSGRESPYYNLYLQHGWKLWKLSQKRTVSTLLVAHCSSSQLRPHYKVGMGIDLTVQLVERLAQQLVRSLYLLKCEHSFRLKLARTRQMTHVCAEKRNFFFN